jgi:hypothetical protein
MRLAPLSGSIKVEQVCPLPIATLASLQVTAINMIVEPTAFAITRGLPGFQPVGIALEKGGEALFQPCNNSKQLRSEPILFRGQAGAKVFADFSVNPARSELDDAAGMPIRRIQIFEYPITEVQTEESVEDEYLPRQYCDRVEFGNHCLSSDQSPRSLVPMCFS